MIAGNILVDIVKTVDSYPKMGMLANISSVKQAVGGCVPNTAIDLAKMDPSLHLAASGRVGSDAYGDYALSQLQAYGIDIKWVSRSAGQPTSFSDVMSLPSGERTFFHARGANAEFAPQMAGLSEWDCDILHVGYLMLLDGFDAEDAEYGTQMARFLHDAQAKGIRTSVDAVSSASGSYAQTVLPALRFCDYVIVNEIEACGVWNLEPRRADGSLDKEAVRGAMEQMVQSGVRGKVIVHSKEAGFCLDAASGAFTEVSSLQLPKEWIQGSVGAGDAFCAGCLYSLHRGFDDETMLRFASAAAACNLSEENSVDGMRSAEEIWQVEAAFPKAALGFGQERIC